MSCNLKDKLTGQMNLTIPENGIVNLSDSNQAEVTNWVMNETNKMLEEGFTDEVFRIEYNEEGKAVLHYNQTAANNYAVFQHYQDSVNVVENVARDMFLEEQYSPNTNTQITTTPQNNQPIVNPVNFMEWKENRVQLLKDLEKLQDRYRKHTDSGIKLKQVNKAILEIKKQLDHFDEKDVDVVHEKLMREINTLSDALNNIAIDPVDAAVMLESNRIKERINDLSIYFNGTDIDLGSTSPNLVDMLKDTFDKNKLHEVQNSIRELEKLYNDNTFNIIKGVFENDDLVHTLKNRPNFDYQAFYDKAMMLIDENSQNPKYLGRNLLGAADVNSLVADLLISLRDSNYSKEVGETQNTIEALKVAWNKIKDMKIGNDYVTNLLFQKDALGVRVSKLLSPYTAAFYKTISEIGKMKSNFYKQRTVKNYASWMYYMKNNVDFLQPAKLSAFDKYRNHPLFQSYFTYSQAEIDAYEQEMKDRLGPTMYELEVNKQLEAIENFVKENDAGLFASPMDVYNKNPFAFVNNFYSQNYNRADQTTGEFLEPGYVKFIPKLDKQINSIHRDVENGPNGKELMDFWKHAHTLTTEYINPSLKSENVSVGLNDLMNERDVLDREILKTLSLFKKVPRTLGEIWKSWLQDFANNRDQDSSKDLLTKYSSYGKNTLKEWQRYYESRPMNELYTIALKNGITNANFQGISPKDLKKILSSSLAQIEINKTSSSNIFNSLVNATDIVRNMNTRRATMATHSVMMDYLKQSKNPSKANLNYLDEWGKLNLKGQKFLKDTVDEEARRKRVFDTRLYTESEKQLKKLIEEEKKNLSGDYTFTYKGLEYRKKGDKYYEIDGPSLTQITKKELEDKYEDYVQDRLNALGVPFQLGSIMLGIQSKLTASSLKGFGIRTGVNNRIVGLHQNMAAAASGEYGFNTSELLKARRFLRGSNTEKMFRYTGLTKKVGLDERDRVQNQKTLLAFVEQLRMLENSMDTLKSEGAFGATGTLLDTVNTILSDFAVNNPEWKNQMEILLAQMQRIKVKDINGNEKQLFDGKNFIFIPGTLELRQEFKTEDNILNWEKRKADKNGNTPQNDLVAKYKAAKSALQGNYSKDDVTPIQGSVLGRTSTMFLRWLFGNTKRQYGFKDIDLRTGKINMEGTKRQMFKHAPTAAVHLAFANGAANAVAGSFMGLATASGSTAILGIGVSATAGIVVSGGLGIAAFGFFAWHNRDRFVESFNRQEVLLAGSYALEVTVRSMNIVPKYFYMDLIKEGKIDKLKYTPSGMSEEERNILSASAEELAQKVGIWAGSAIATTLAGIIYTALTGAGDEDDEEEYAKKMKGLEGYLNWIINTKNSLYDDLDKYSNPLTFAETAASFTYYKTVLKAIQLFTGKDGKESELDKMVSGKTSTEEGVVKMGNTLTRFSGLPASFYDLIVEDKSLIQDERQYDKGDWFDEIADNKTKTTEQNYKDATGMRRRQISEDVKDKIRNMYMDKGEDIDEEDVSEKAQNFMRNLGLYKSRKESYEELSNSDAWNNVDSSIESMSEDDLEHHKKSRKKDPEAPEDEGGEGPENEAPAEDE